jgi:ABC-type Zn uptake system ZnuABC Zn-binding protein ZnuA
MSALDHCWPRTPRAWLCAGLVVALVAAPLPRSEADDRVRVAATIFPLFDIVRRVGGPLVDTVLVLPPGASPHTFEPTPASVRALSGAGALFVIGHGLDDWAGRVARGAGVPRLVPVDTGIALRRADAGVRARVDPHYWLSASNARTIAHTVAGELKRLTARHAEVDGGLAGYLAQLDAADAEVRSLMAELPMRRIATFHDAFGYFADAYGLQVAAVFEPYPGLEPSPRFVVEFQRTVRAAGIRVVFMEPQLSVDALRPIARDLGVTLAVLDPIGGLPGRETYIDLLLFNARAISDAARRSAP